MVRDGSPFLALNGGPSLECFGLAKTSTEFLLGYFVAAVGGGLEEARDGYFESC